MDLNKFPLLAGIDDPLMLHGLAPEQLDQLCAEAREFLIETISSTGGHLGAALGVVELTVALFNQFDFLKDRIAWDVGHQAHVYKMLTGRMGRFEEYGRWGGLCKFLERVESPFDHMGAGHASTSISAALGMAIARDQRGEDHQVLAVIGDGAMTGGMAYEALSMAGSLELNLLVILNDNGMSIDNNVGALTRTVTRITASEPYNALRDELKRVSQKVPFGTEFLRGLKHMERSVKEYVSLDQSSFFEALNFKYFGPVDGHNLAEVASILNHAKTIRGPILLHLLTVKGKGLGPDIENTFEAHAVSPEKPKALNAPPRKTWTAIYSQGLADLMAKDDKVVALTAAMQSNTGLSPLAEAHPGRVLDMGIAEEGLFTSAAGMAIGGQKPFVTVYSTFSQRAFDQMIHDIALQNLPVRIMMDRGGFVGADGPTHHGIFDHSFLRMIPNMVHMAPRDELEMRRMLLTAHAYEDGPIAMRYPRGETESMPMEEPLTPVPVGEGEVLRQQKNGLLLVAVGTMVKTALQVSDALAGKKIPCSVVDARFIKPLDEKLLLEQIAGARAVITLEENVGIGGFGEGVLSLMANHDLMRPFRNLAAPDAFISFGSQEEQLRASGLTVEQALETARELWAMVTSPQSAAQSTGPDTRPDTTQDTAQATAGKKRKRTA